MYILILIWVIYSINAIKAEYVDKWEARLNNLEVKLDTNIANDDKFFENADYYITSLDNIQKQNKELSAKLEEINQHLKDLELY